MRVAIAGLFEEVNTFAVETMGLATITGSMTSGFEKWAGQTLIDNSKGTRTYVGGFLDALANFPDVEVVPTVLYQFGAGPTIEAAAYRTMKADILDALKAAQPLDAVLLSMHGAGVAQGEDDVEGDIARAVRDVLGPDVKIVTALDLHTNAPVDFIEPHDFMTAVHHYPHIDMYDAAYRAAMLVPAMVKGEVTPHGHLEPVPFLMQMLSTMDGNTYAEVRDKVIETSKRPGLFEFSLFYGFPMADVPFNTAVVNCWAETPELARETAQEFGCWLWDNRARFVVKPMSASEAVQKALDLLASEGRITEAAATTPLLMEESLARLASADEEHAASSGFFPDQNAGGPIVIAEMSDNTGGGAPGDATHVLWELIRNRVEHAAVCTIRDPDTVKQAMAAGVGQIIDVELGGKGSRTSGEPVRGKAYVKSISDGRYTIVSEMGQGVKMDTGPAVGLVIEGIDVAVVSGIMQPFDNGQLKTVGFDARDYRIVVLKSANHFRAWWSKIASHIIDADPPGLASNDLSTYAFQKKRGKVYPLDQDAHYP